MIILLFVLLVILPLGFAQDSLSDPTLAKVETPHDEYAAVQMPAQEGKPVQWVKQVEVQNLYDQAETEVIVNVPDEAENVKVVDESNNDVDSDKQQSDVTIKDNLVFNEQKTYVVKYETPAPEKTESGLTKDGKRLVKNVVVSSDYHYKEVYTTASLPNVPKMDKDMIRLYWKIDGLRKDVTNDPEFNLQLLDEDGDGKYEKMAWTTPHLSTQIFEIVILSDVDPGAYPSIGLDLLSPSDGEYITSTSKVNFNYSVSYNSSTTVYCNLTVDGDVKRENIATTSDSEITTYFNLSSGQHDWYVNCTGSDGSSNISQVRSFTIDLDQPKVTLDTPDYYVSNTDSVRLDFTVVDDEYPAYDCFLSVNGVLNQSNIIAMNDSQESILLPNMVNGIYNWNVSCKDAAGNWGKSEERIFYISQGTPSEYNISANKATYGIGEEGYLLINAPSGSNLTLFVSKPNHDSFFKYFNGQNFPFVDMINYTSNSGEYDIDGIFIKGGDVFIIKTSFDVTNTFYVNIDSNETTGEPYDEFNFEANATGGIGTVTYEWNFDDDSKAQTGSEVDHNFTNSGNYYVEVTATDSKGNKVTDTIHIRIFKKYDVKVVVKELQTGKMLENMTVEMDDQRKETNASGEVVFSVYEGKQRIYVAEDGYEWYKAVKNITEDNTITVELNNTAMTNFTRVDNVSAGAGAGITENETNAMNDAENLLAKIEAAIENLESGDAAQKSVLEALKVKEGLQKAKKTLRQIIRDLGNAETDTELTDEQRKEMIKNITKSLDNNDGLIMSAVVEETTDYVDYPKSTTIEMLSAEYLNHKKLDYSEKQKKKYAESNSELQKEVIINSRLSIVEIETLGGEKRKISVVTNTLNKKPEGTSGTVLIEYLPKEVAQKSDEIEQLTEFTVVKSDPILLFDSTLDSYSYYVNRETTLENLKNTKHVMLYDVEAGKDKGLSQVTGKSILPNLKFENPKLVIEILVIVLLLLAYLVYHFDVPDMIREWRKKREGTRKAKNDPNNAPYETDMAYKPESRFETLARKAKSFVNKEEEVMSEEISHIKALLHVGHLHVQNKKHDKAKEVYEQVQEIYKGLPKEHKAYVHDQTKELYHKISLAKVEQLLEEALIHCENGDLKKAKNHYSEIKKLYAKLETKHRAAVSERCIQLHQKLFETSLM